VSTVVGFSVTEIARQAAVRPPEWLTELEACIVKRANGWVWVDQDRPQYLAMMAKYRGQPRPSLNVEGPPTAEWPAPRPRGLGDTIARVTKALGIKPCGGCQKRQEALNKLVPYKQG
jgi:hypothetical protein